MFRFLSPDAEFSNMFTPDTVGQVAGTMISCLTLCYIHPILKVVLQMFPSKNRYATMQVLKCFPLNILQTCTNPARCNPQIIGIVSAGTLA